MTNKLADARRSLIRAREAAEKRLDELDNERREIRGSLKSLEAALKALGKPGRRRASNRPVAGRYFTVYAGVSQGASNNSINSSSILAHSDSRLIDDSSREITR